MNAAPIYMRLIRNCKPYDTSMALVTFCCGSVFGMVMVYSLSGCCPSWAFHAHSVIFISEKMAVKDDSSGEQA